MTETVSIITPYYNASRFVSEYFQSLLSQTYPYWICILINDHSTDDSYKKIQNLALGDARFKILNNYYPKSYPCPASARNYGLDHVDTDLVAFWDIDDLWHPDKLALQVHYHIQNQLDISVTAYTRFPDVQIIPLNSIVIKPPTSALTFRSLLRKNSVPMLTAMINIRNITARFEQVPHEDYLFWLMIFKNNQRLRYGCLPLLLAFYRVHENNITVNKLLMPAWVYAVYRKLGLSQFRSVARVVVWMLSHLSQVLVFSVSKRLRLPLDTLLELPPLHL